MELDVNELLSFATSNPRELQKPYPDVCATRVKVNFFIITRVNLKADELDSGSRRN